MIIIVLVHRLSYINVFMHIIFYIDCQSQLETERKEKLEITAELNKISNHFFD